MSGPPSSGIIESEALFAVEKCDQTCRHFSSLGASLRALPAQLTYHHRKPAK
jgi:hypothetical protein